MSVSVCSEFLFTRARLSSQSVGENGRPGLLAVYIWPALADRHEPANRVITPHRMPSSHYTHIPGPCQQPTNQAAGGRKTKQQWWPSAPTDERDLPKPPSEPVRSFFFSSRLGSACGRMAAVEGKECTVTYVARWRVACSAIRLVTEWHGAFRTLMNRFDMSFFSFARLLLIPQRRCHNCSNPHAR